MQRNKINLKLLDNHINTPNADVEWISIKNSKNGIIQAGEIAGDQLISNIVTHVSIDTSRYSEAVRLIASELNRDDAPCVSIKFPTIHSLESNPEKAGLVTVSFNDTDLANSRNVKKLLSRIDIALTSRRIGAGSSNLNYEYDAYLLNNDQTPTRFTYKDRSCLLLEEDVETSPGGRKHLSEAGIHHISVPSDHINPYATMKILTAANIKLQVPVADGMVPDNVNINAKIPSSYKKLIESERDLIDGIKTLFRDYAHPRFLSCHWNRHHNGESGFIADYLPETIYEARHYLKDIKNDLAHEVETNKSGSMMRRLTYAISRLEDAAGPGVVPNHGRGGFNNN